MGPPPRGDSPKGCLLADALEKPAADVVPEWIKNTLSQGGNSTGFFRKALILLDIPDVGRKY